MLVPVARERIEKASRARPGVPMSMSVGISRGHPGLSLEWYGGSIEVKTLEETCQARVVAVGATPFPVLDLEVTPGDEMRVVGTSRGLLELAHLVAPSALTAASDITDQPEGTAL